MRLHWPRSAPMGHSFLGMGASVRTSIPSNCLKLPVQEQPDAMAGHCGVGSNASFTISGVA